MLPRKRNVRNVLIAIGNSKNSKFVDSVQSLLSDTSTIVRSMAVWALKNIMDDFDFNKMREIHLTNEKEKDVVLEWNE